ncbi:hypothetical protein [Nocardia terpenica]|uniref:Uncharacterized protein n=1 Tax=Nocardia terpenica TaxID=455432 RepID=A0A164KDV1_9NOCA|nr:hypothetical protein [Nocardia terpenica]KZM71300.1 hypothetical protein AWN90_00505 [Nocardia terpenica]NQE90439.1 hypothetical protein [Nocardia terpenica]
MTEQEPAPENPGMQIVDVSPTEPEPENAAVLSVHYRDGKPVFVATGGSVVPSVIEVENASGNVVAHYAVDTAPTARGVRVNFWQGISISDENGADLEQGSE